MPLLNSPITLFSLLVDQSPHGLDCPKADAAYKLHVLTGKESELTKLRVLRTELDAWIRLLEETS